MSCNSLARGNCPLSTLSSRLLWRYYPICYSNPSIAQRHLGSPTRKSWRNQYPQGAHITSQQTSNSSWFRRLSAESLISIDAEVAEGCSVFTLRRYCAWWLTRGTYCHRILSIDSYDFPLRKISFSTLSSTAESLMSDLHGILTWPRDKCYWFGCHGCSGNLETKRRGTVQTDVYAFGCLHYAASPSTFFSISGAAPNWLA